MDLSPIHLPYGKLYHLFFSFCDDDEERVFSLLSELEDKYHLKCLYHKRDFQPGISVVKNIMDGIEKSMNIVYFVSQEFKESAMCKMEVEYGITAAHKQCENSLIPVLLELTEMPRELQTLNYVDGTSKETNIANKVYNACLFGVTENCILPNIIQVHGLANGTPLRVIRRKDTDNWGIPLTYFSEDIEKREKINDEARSQQIDELCSDVVVELNSCRYTTNYFLHKQSFWRRLWCSLTLGVQGLATILLLLFLISGEGDITEEILVGACSTLVVVPIVAISIIIYCCYVKKKTLKDETVLNRLVGKYLHDNYKTLKVLTLLRSSEEVTDFDLYKYY